ncbi:Porin P precursor [Planctomycetes bacterium Pan216]|uniref:Porin P n=1 Tax=Kolteria novifilia TaxID=2527975 RepID=A0A518B374_9BACT|nr:Porin P precursor [Planctomycetes bacterium Pan216]
MVGRTFPVLALFLSLIVPTSAISSDDSTAEPTSAAEVEVIKERIESLEEVIAELKKELGDDEPSKKDEPERLSDEFMEKIEKRIDEFEKKIPPKPDTFNKANIKLQGRVHIDFVNFPTATSGIGSFENPSTGDQPQSRFLFRRLRLGAKGNIFQNLKFKTIIEFADPSSIAMKDAYLEMNHLPIVEDVLVGNFKRPLGMEAINSSNNNVFMERSLPIQAFNEDERRFGLISYIETDDERATMAHGFFTTKNIANDGNYTGSFGNLSFNNRYTYLPWWDESSDGRGFLHLGIANMVASNDPDFGSSDPNNQARFSSRPELRSVSRWVDTGRIADTTLWDTMGLEMMLNAGSLSVVSEFLPTWVVRPGQENLFFPGWYTMVAYILTGETREYQRFKGAIGGISPHEPFFLAKTCDGPKMGIGAWEAAVRYSYVDLSDADIEGGVQSDVTAALNWYLNSWSRVQMNYVIGDIKQHAPVNGFTSGSFTGFGVRFMAYY